VQIASPAWQPAIVSRLPTLDGDCRAPNYEQAGQQGRRSLWTLQAIETARLFPTHGLVFCSSIGSLLREIPMAVINPIQ
jgi:PAS domain-containing protein